MKKQRKLKRKVRVKPGLITDMLQPVSDSPLKGSVAWYAQEGSDIYLVHRTSDGVVRMMRVVEGKKA